MWDEITSDAIPSTGPLNKFGTSGDRLCLASACSNVASLAEFVNMALKLMEATQDFRSSQGHKVQVRAGISLGPVLNACVGSKAPAFSVYGEPVAMAHKLQSTGLPQRLHVSATAARLLIGHPFFHVENRGLVELKGGVQETYW